MHHHVLVLLFSYIIYFTLFLIYLLHNAFGGISFCFFFTKKKILTGILARVKVILILSP